MGEHLPRLWSCGGKKKDNYDCRHRWNVVVRKSSTLRQHQIRVTRGHNIVAKTGKTWFQAVIISSVGAFYHNDVPAWTIRRTERCSSWERWIRWGEWRWRRRRQWRKPERLFWCRKQFRVRVSVAPPRLAWCESTKPTCDVKWGRGERGVRLRNCFPTQWQLKVNKA